MDVIRANPITSQPDTGSFDWRRTQARARGLDWGDRQL